MTETILQEAERLINGDRAQQYGSAGESFQRIADLWSVYLQLSPEDSLTSNDVANLMILMKVSRAKNGFHRDSYVDIGGYAGLTEQLELVEEPIAPSTYSTATDFAEGEVFTPVSGDNGRWRVELGMYRFIYQNGEVATGDVGLWGQTEVDHHSPFKYANPTGPYRDLDG